MEFLFKEQHLWKCTPCSKNSIIDPIGSKEVPGHGLKGRKNTDGSDQLSLGFPCASHGKESAYSAGDPGSIPGSGRSSGEGNGNPLQYSCLENPMDRGA